MLLRHTHKTDAARVAATAVVVATATTWRRVAVRWRHAHRGQLVVAAVRRRDAQTGQRQAGQSVALHHGERGRRVVAADTDDAATGATAVADTASRSTVGKLVRHGRDGRQRLQRRQRRIG